MIYIIPGLIHAGTTYMTRRLEAAGVNMGTEQTQNAECVGIHRIIKEALASRGECDRLKIEMDTPRRLFDQVDVRAELREYRKQREAEGCEHWGFKHPSCDMILESLLDVFSKAVYLICLRDLDKCAQKRVREVAGLNIEAAKCLLATREGYLLRYVPRSRRYLWHREDADALGCIGIRLGLVLTAEGWRADV